MENKAEKEAGKFCFWVVCHDKKRRNHLVNFIRLRFSFDVEEFEKLDDLPRENTFKVAAIVMSLVDGRADVSWEIGIIYRRWFRDVPLLIEVPPDTSQEEALKFVEYGGWTVFGSEDDVTVIIENVIGSLYDYTNSSEVTKRCSVTEKTFLQKIKMALKIVLQLF